ncbi:MAG: type III-B CRISPR-associated protein Cas10/Cmr2 [Acidobacteria bacterium]|nr:type III-B CRISPR-associated protein Cas10/Cmr2 [Acidobacteriota bacterium]MBI3657021.1 type III-B CRISPR-associated protein Cas10/Cmr2 [Acidobacteriota bacterium]
MTAHLLAIAIGPVQAFIAAARRTRDLWFGSLLLSEISKAAARAVSTAGGQLIFPAPHALDDLKKESQFNVANVIMAELSEGLTPNAVKESAEDAAKACWQSYAEEARSVAGELIDPNIWNGQIDDVIEFYAAWTPLKSSDQYRHARQRLMRLLAGRKALRNFRPAHGHAGVPKSSLDGARETVLVCESNQHDTRNRRRSILRKNENDGLAQRLRLSAGEELDIIGITKRAATKEAFASVVRVAADPWIRGIKARSGEAENTLRQIADQCKGAAFATGTGRHYSGIFPFDGSVLYPSRLQSMLRVPRGTEHDTGAFDDLFSESDRETLKSIQALLGKLQKRTDGGMGYGEPDPYFAILVADGDRIGKTISNIGSAVEHRKFSQNLAAFAGQARHIVEESHHGCLVYSGGDDVLAFVPVDQSLDCARRLHDQFHALLSAWRDDAGNSPTLSVGLVIGHCMEPLEDLLEYGRTAEKAAKEPDRNGIAVHLHTRGGASIQIRTQWSTDSDALDKRLKKWADMHRKDQIPDKAAYGLRELVRDYKSECWPTETGKQSSALAAALQSDALRRIKRKKGQQGDKGLMELERLLRTIASVADVRRVANEIILSRRIAVALSQAEGRPMDLTFQEVSE